MDRNTIKGKLDVVAGRAKRQAGEWTGNSQVQVEGAVQEIKGKVEQAVGKVKDVVKDANAEARGPRLTQPERMAAEKHRYEEQ
jgi:uncharacterized protein YjbJ (UPF0337 family)